MDTDTSFIKCQGYKNKKFLKLMQHNNKNNKGELNAFACSKKIILLQFASTLK